MSTENPKLTKEQARVELMRISPMFFRENLLMNVEKGRVSPFRDCMEDWQREDFVAQDPCFKFLAGLEPEPDIRRFFIQRARGHSKTSDEATSITWLLWASRKKVNGIGVAEDREQAGLLREQMWNICLNNPWLQEVLEYRTKEVVNKFTGSTFSIWSSDVSSSWGITPDFVVCDELTHWSNQIFWTSVFSSFAKKDKMLTVLCNAGAGRDWKYDIKKHAIESKQWYHIAREGCVASWINEQTIDEQRACLPPTEFGRLWLNRWQETGGEFVTLEEAEACRDEGMKIAEETYADGWTYVASLDYAEKHDRTVGCVTHREGNIIYVDRMDIVCPKVTQKSTRVDWCENWMNNVQDRFGATKGQVYFVIDEYQLTGVRQRLEDKGYNITSFDFASGRGNWEMGLYLRQFIIHQFIKWYPSCGQILDSKGAPVQTQLKRDDLEIELASLVVKNYSGGKRWKFDHLQDNVHHDDRAFALGACVWFYVHNDGADDWSVAPPGTDNNFWV